MARTLRPEDGIRHLSDEELLNGGSEVQEHFSSRSYAGVVSSMLNGSNLVLTLPIDTQITAEITGVLRCLNPDQFPILTPSKRSVPKRRKHCHWTMTPSATSP